MRDTHRSSSSGSEKLFYLTPGAFDAGWRNEYVALAKPTVIRLYPHFANGQPEPQLIFKDDNQGAKLIGQMIAPYQAINNFGPEKISGITEVTDPIENVAGPVDVLIQRLRDLQETDGVALAQSGDSQAIAVYQRIHDWVLTKKEGGGPNDKRPKLRPPATTLFMRGVATLIRGEQPINFVSKQPEAQHKTILRVSQSAMNNLVEGMTTPLDASQPLSVENSVLGDLIGPNGFSLRISDYTSANDQGMKITRYKFERDVSVPLDPATVFQHIYDQGTFCSWDSIIFRPTLADLFQKLMLACGADVVTWAFQEHPTYAKYVGCAPINVQAQAQTPSYQPTAHVVQAAQAAPGDQIPGLAAEDPRITAMRATGLPEEAIKAAAAAAGIPYAPKAPDDPRVAALRAAGLPEAAIQAALATMGSAPAQTPAQQTQAPMPAPPPAGAPTASTQQNAAPLAVPVSAPVTTPTQPQQPAQQPAQAPVVSDAPLAPPNASQAPQQQQAAAMPVTTTAPATTAPAAQADGMPDLDALAAQLQAAQGNMEETQQQGE